MIKQLTLPIAALFALTIAGHASATNFFVPAGGTGAVYSVAVSNTVMYSISTESAGGGNYRIKQSVGGQWSYQDSSSSGSSITTSVHDGSLWVTASNGVWQHVGSTWQNLPSAVCGGGTMTPRQTVGHNNIAVGWDDEYQEPIIWVIGSNRSQIYGMTYPEYNCWTAQPLLPSPANDITIDVTQGGHTYPFVQVDAGHGCYRHLPGWTAMTSCAAYGVAVWQGIQNVIGTDSPSGIYSYTSSWNQNTSYTPGTTTPSQIANVFGTSQHYNVFGAFVSSAGQAWYYGAPVL